MTTFPEAPDDTYDIIYLEDTDRPLPQKLNPGMRYAYFKTVARGGKSIIQSCRDLHLGRTVCYKSLRPELADNAIEQQRFLREARVSAMLQHPNTVPTYEIGRDRAGKIYFTMKLVHGYTLREIFDYRERYDLVQLIDVIIQIARPLAYAHSHRVVHRDIKPENILVGPFGEVLLLDWGLAKVWQKDGTPKDLPSQDTEDDPPAAPEDLSLTAHGKLDGTVAYMSPEQIQRDREIDFRTDIYSLGVVLYELLAGRAPVEGDIVYEVTDQIVNEVPERPEKAGNRRVPKLLSDLTMACIEKDPLNRPASCGEIVRMLQEDW